jgi:hypothetical protein
MSRIMEIYPSGRNYFWSEVEELVQEEKEELKDRSFDHDL